MSEILFQALDLSLQSIACEIGAIILYRLSRIEKDIARLAEKV